MMNGCSFRFRVLSNLQVAAIHFQQYMTTCVHECEQATSKRTGRQMLDLTLTLHHYYMQTCYPRIQSPEYTIAVWSLSSYIDLSHYSLLAINVLRFDYYS